MWLDKHHRSRKRCRIRKLTGTLKQRIESLQALRICQQQTEAGRPATSFDALVPSQRIACTGSAFRITIEKSAILNGRSVTRASRDPPQILHFITCLLLTRKPSSTNSGDIGIAVGFSILLPDYPPLADFQAMTGTPEKQGGKPSMRL